MDVRRFLDVPGRSAIGPDRDDLVVWCRGPVEQHTSAVLLVHDRLGNARIWDLVLSRLPAGVAAVALDLRGRGSAWRQSPSLGVASHVADVIDVLDRLDIDDVLVVGHGFGAVIASQLGSDVPERAPLTVGVVMTGDADPFESMIGLAFPDREEHLRFWRRHDRFVAADQRAIDGFVSHGIAGPEDHHRWRVDVRSLVADDHAAMAVTGLSFTRSITVASPVAMTPTNARPSVVAAADIQLVGIDPAVALLVAAGADAIVAQIRPFLS